MRWLRCLALVPVVAGLLLGQKPVGPAAPAGEADSPAGPPAFQVTTVWLAADPGGRPQWHAGPESPPVPPGAAQPVPLFRALAGRDWPEGWVPLFAVDRAGRAELRRLPPRGLAHQADPLCFIRPRIDEPEAARLAGTWTCQARSEHGARHRVRWQLTVAGEQVAGRLDQETDYRFAHLAGGTWRSNRLVLQVEYIADRYELAGTWENGRLRGTWRREDGADGGAWEAERPAPEGPMPRLAATRDLVREPDPPRGFRHRLAAGGPGPAPPVASLGRVAEP
ncbi:MAG: hypothetical protein ACKOET_11555 [Verrucomicrobiota bacterium]